MAKTNTHTIHAPVGTFNGDVAGVSFTDGQGEAAADNVAALTYFRRSGYGIDEPAAPRGPAPEPDQDPTDTHRTVGTRLRDASVDPRPTDFLEPTNAGNANPHGPRVVSPEIHGSQGTRPVKPGDVHVDDVDAQDAAERAHTEAAVAGGDLFDPSAHNVAAVNDHLTAAADAGDTAEVERVLAAEAAGDDRSTVKAPVS